MVRGRNLHSTGHKVRSALLSNLPLGPDFPHEKHNNDYGQATCENKQMIHDVYPR